MPEPLTLVAVGGGTTVLMMHLARRYFEIAKEVVDIILGSIALVVSLPVLAVCAIIIKISGRGTSRLIDRGLDLASVLSEAASSLDGRGGGHNIAAGATIPLEKDEEFLEKVDELVGKQIKPINNKKEL